MQEHTNDPAHRADTSLDETTAGAIVSMPMDVAAPHYNLAKATQDQGHHQTTNTSAQSTSRDHPVKDAKTTDPPRPSEDPGEDDDACHPDEPTELSDQPVGMRG